MVRNIESGVTAEKLEVEEILCNLPPDAPLTSVLAKIGFTGDLAGSSGRGKGGGRI